MEGSTNGFRKRALSPRAIFAPTEIVSSWTRRLSQRASPPFGLIQS
jgi:hypothetical protein